MIGAQSYILRTSPRSGSTLLCRLLRATGVAGHPRSYFHEPSLAAWREGVDLPVHPSAESLDALKSTIEAIQTAGSAETPVFGARLQRKSFAFFAQQLGRLHPGTSSIMDRITACFGPTRLIYLTRDDKVAQAVSFLRATQSGLWHKASDGHEIERLAPPGTLRYDRAEIARYVAEFTANDAAWENWFRAESLAPLRLSYDALTQDPNATVGRILSAMGQDPAPARSVVPDVAKLSDKTNTDWIARFKAGA